MHLAATTRGRPRFFLPHKRHATEKRPTSPPSVASLSPSMESVRLPFTGGFRLRRRIAVSLPRDLCAAQPSGMRRRCCGDHTHSTDRSCLQSGADVCPGDWGVRGGGRGGQPPLPQVQPPLSHAPVAHTSPEAGRGGPDTHRSPEVGRPPAPHFLESGAGDGDSGVRSTGGPWGLRGSWRSLRQTNAGTSPVRWLRGSGQRPLQGPLGCCPKAAPKWGQWGSGRVASHRRAS